MTDITEQIPFDMPDGWAWVRLSNLCDFSNGISKRNGTDGIETIVLRLADLTDNTISFENTRSIRLTHKELQQYQIIQGDLLFVRVNGSRQNVGKVYLFAANKVAAYCDHLIRATLYPLINGAFIRHTSLSATVRKAMDKYIITSAGQHTISQVSLNSLLFPLPPLAEQKRIVAAIEAQFEIIKQIENEQAELSDLATLTKSKILDLAMRGKLVSQDPADEPASELLARVSTSHKSHYDDIPLNWVECQLESVLDYEQPQKYIVESTDYDDSYKTPVLTAGKSFILGYTNETSGVFTNLPCIIFDDFTSDSKLVNFQYKVKSSAMKMLIAKKELVDTKFIYYLMQTVKVDTSTHKRYWLSDFSKRQVLIPPLKEQIRIVAAIESIFGLINSMND